MLKFNQFLHEKESPENNTKGTTVQGIHYSHTSGLHELHGSRFGTGIKGAEQRRLNEPGTDTRIKSRVYFYNKAAHEKLPKIHEGGLGQHAHSATLTKIYDPEKASPEHRAEVNHHAQKYKDEGHHPSNAFESGVVDSGYHGYTNGQMTVVLNHPRVPVKYEGHKADILRQ